MSTSTFQMAQLSNQHLLIMQSNVIYQFHLDHSSNTIDRVKFEKILTDWRFGTKRAHQKKYQMMDLSTIQHLHHMSQFPIGNSYCQLLSHDNYQATYLIDESNTKMVQLNVEFSFVFNTDITFGYLLFRVNGTQSLFVHDLSLVFKGLLLFPTYWNYNFPVLTFFRYNAHIGEFNLLSNDTCSCKVTLRAANR